MTKKLFESFMFSLEWRLYAYVITSLFLWATTGHLAVAAVQALGLQFVLFVCQSIWHYLRSEGKLLTLDTASSWIAQKIVRALRR